MPARRLIDCIFCGDLQVPSSEEDIVPKWLADKLRYYALQHEPDLPTNFVEYTYDNLESFNADRESGLIEESTGKVVHGARPTAHKLPDVCETCNGGWMSRLEDAVGMVSPGLLVGTQKALSPFDQLILATWAVKTCITYDAARTPRHITGDAGGLRLFRYGRPWVGIDVAIGHVPNWTPRGGWAHARYLLRPTHLGPPHFDVVAIAFQFEHLVLKTIFNHPSLPGEVGMTLNSHEEVIWPLRERFVWPSDFALDSPIRPTRGATGAAAESPPQKADRPHHWRVRGGVVVDADAGLAWGGA